MVMPENLVRWRFLLCVYLAALGACRQLGGPSTGMTALLTVAVLLRGPSSPGVVGSATRFVRAAKSKATLLARCILRERGAWLFLVEKSSLQTFTCWLFNRLAGCDALRAVRTGGAEPVR